jgi:DNA-binding beta-propeller fold protein YncE
MAARYILHAVLVLGLWLAAAPSPTPAAGQQLQYTTTWLGNTFGGGDKWVQNFIEGLYVAPDGTAYTASGWDEAGREFGIYRDGAVIGKAADTHGWGTNGGPAVTASGKYMFIAHSHGNEGGGLKGEKYPPKGLEWFGISRRNLDGSHAKFPGGGGRFGDMLVLHEVETKANAQVRGLAVDATGGRLFASDPHEGEIKVFDVETMKQTAAWKVARPGPIALDAKGTLWIIQAADEGEGDAGAEPAKVLRFSPDGVALAQHVTFDKATVPTALAINRKTGDLLVADNGPAQHVLIFGDLDTTPKWTGTFGEPGGLYAGPTPGLVGPKRFAGLTGVGADAAGSLYVGCNTPAGGAVLRAFSPDGAMTWELLGLEFVDAADVDPADGTDGANVYTSEGHYVCDWSKPAPGGQWSWRGFSLDPFKYPDDLRLHEGHHGLCGALLRHIGGHRFLVVRGMFEHFLAIYRYDGEIAVPSAAFSRNHYKDGAWAPPGQPEKGTWLWRDASGDGQMQTDGYLDNDGTAPGEYWARWMDERGDVWEGQQSGKEPIRRYTCQGLDPKGNPVYSKAKSETFALPAPMNHLLRIEYHAADDVMYLTGHTTDRPKTGGEWGQVGTEVLRFDNWAKGNRTPRWRIALPYSPETKIKTPGASVSNATIKSFCTAEGAVFAVESRSARVHVYDSATGAKLGEMTPGPEVGKESGWVDIPDGIRAYKRSGGEYLVFVEEDAKGKIIVYRWKR